MSHRLSSVRPLLFAGAAFATLAATSASAQSVEEPVVGAVDTQIAESDEIVVVARRREERLIDVPLAVTAISDEDLAKLQAVDLSGIQGTVPNLNLVQGRGSASNANIFIRGIGQPDALQTFDPAVGVYVDGVYISRINGALFNLFDVERVEVLRGPQGTLYGKNSTGGAVNIVSRKPSVTDLTAAGSVTYGSYDQLLVNGYVSAPLVDGTVGLSLAGVYDQRDGLVTDPVDGREYNDRDTIAGRAILRALPSDSIELLLSADYTRQRPEPTVGYATAPLLATSFTTGVRVLSPAYPYGEYDYRARTSLAPGQGQELDHWGVNLTANIDLSDSFTVTSISAYRDLVSDAYIDIDATEFELGDVFVGIDQYQFSQELQLKYSSDRLNGVFGLYYLYEKVTSHQEAYADDLFELTPAVGYAFTRFIDDDQRLNSYAAYGQLTYDLTDQFSVTGGLRYTKEEKRYDRYTVTASSLALLNGLSFRFPDDLPAPYNATNEATFDAWTPSVTLSYKPTRDTLLYVSASRGFKSGGFNGRVNSLNDVTEVVDGVTTIRPYFEPETVWTYEGGAKGRFLDGRVNLSGAVFYSDYRDFQARVGAGNNTGTGGALPVLNAGKLRIWGFEFEADVRPVPEWSVRTSFGYLNADYLEFDDARRAPASAFSCNPTGNEIVCEPAFAPPITLSFATDYTIDLGNAGGITFGGDLRFVDKHYLSIDNRPGLTEDGYELANAFVQYTTEDGRFYLRGGVKNLTGSLYKTDGQEFSSIGNIQTAYYGDPRTWSITAGFRF
ncbi:TonB-dependent receptor [Sphingosinithalassobacter sp. LHW66-3]|uniref:TonB-dependent receptor n=1 Tax=Sphingosinithalassobacter sp. LHW66-3 TaxID=3424718 RepID=UPI003D6B5185